MRVPVDVRADPDDARALQAWVDVLADGRRLRMLLDTGNTRTAVPQWAGPMSMAQSPVDAGHGTSGTPATEVLAEVGELTMGDYTASKLTVAVQPDDWPHPPLLGTDLINAHVCRFRFSRSELEIDVEPSNEASWAPWGTSSTPAVDICWKETTVRAVWDTGAGVTIVDRSWADEHPEAVTVLDDDADHGTDVTGQAVPGARGWLAAFTVGGADFPAGSCGVVDLAGLNQHLPTPISMFLGLPQISQADWYIDFPGHRWAIAPRPSPTSIHQQG